MKANLEKDKFFIDLVNFGFYIVKNDGTITDSYGKNAKYKHNKGYFVVTFYHKDVKKVSVILAHRLVCIVFNGLIDDDSLQINHIDGNKTNNNINNLELVTNKRNVQHAYDTGLNKVTDYAKQKSKERSIGEKNIMAVFSDNKVLYYREQYKNRLMSKNDIIVESGACRRAVEDMLKGKSFSHLKFYKLDKIKFNRDNVDDKTNMCYELWKSGKSLNSLSKEFNISRTTLRDRFKIIENSLRV